MRKLIIFVVLAIVLAIVVAFLGYMYSFHKRELGLICDKIGITENTFEIAIDEEIENYIFIYWYGETPNPAKKNRILFFYRFLQSDIPSSQGKNLIEIQFGDFIYNRIGVYKQEGYSKHNYSINIKSIDEGLAISWCISNWYDTEVLQGKDTLVTYNREEHADL